MAMGAANNVLESRRSKALGPQSLVYRRSAILEATRQIGPHQHGVRADPQRRGSVPARHQGRAFDVIPIGVTGRGPSDEGSKQCFVVVVGGTGGLPERWEHPL